MRSRLIWLLLAVCVVTFLGIGLWTKGEKKEVKEEALPKMEALPEIETLQEPKQAVKEEILPLPQEQPLEEPGKAEPVIMEPIMEERVIIQGPVTNMDPCTQSIMVGNTDVDISHLDLPMYQTFKIGDVVEVTYIKRKYGNVMESFEILEKK